MRGIIPFLLMLLEIVEMFEAQVLIFIAIQNFTVLYVTFALSDAVSKIMTRKTGNVAIF